MQQNIQQQTTVSVQNGLIDMCKKLLGLKEVSVYEWNNHDNEYFVVHDDVNHKDILLVAKNSGAMILRHDYFANACDVVLDSCRQVYEKQNMAKEQAKQQKLDQERRKATILTMWHVKNRAKSILGENYKLVRKDSDNSLIQICTDILNSKINIGTNETLRNLFWEFFIKDMQEKTIFRISYRLDKKVFNLSVWNGISYEFGYDTRKLSAKNYANFSSDENGFKDLDKLFNLAERVYNGNVKTH